MPWTWPTASVPRLGGIERETARGKVAGSYFFNEAYFKSAFGDYVIVSLFC